LVALSDVNGYALTINNACTVHGGLVSGAQTEAAFHNTVTTYHAVLDLNNDLVSLGSKLDAIDAHLTGVDNHVAAELAALDAHLVALVNQLSNQMSQTTALLDAHLKQVMKLQLTPDGQKSINPAILTCNGPNCPDVLASCPAAGCYWNKVGPLP